MPSATTPPSLRKRSWTSKRATRPSTPARTEELTRTTEAGPLGAVGALDIDPALGGERCREGEQQKSQRKAEHGASPDCGFGREMRRAGIVTQRGGVTA